VFNIYQSVRRIYKLLDAEKNIGLQFAEGPHMDTQPLNVGEFHWMMRFLQGADLMSTIDAPAVKSIPMEKLRVFAELPKDERNTKIDESFVPKAADAKVPEQVEDWKVMRSSWMSVLKEKCFAGNGEAPESFEMIAQAAGEQAGDGRLKRAFLPETVQDYPLGPAEVIHEKPSPTMEKLDAALVEGVSMELFKLHPGIVGEIPLDLYVLRRADLKPQDLELVVLNVLDEKGWQDFADIAIKADAKGLEQEKKMFQNFKWGMAYVCPRGIGPSAWDKPVKAGDAKAKTAAEKASTHRLRRFYLLGQTLDGQQMWDIRHAIRGLRAVDGLKETKLWVQASRMQAGNAVYASLYEDGITRLDLHEVPHSHEQGPIYLNVLKYLDLPQAVAMASERTRVIVYDDDKEAWAYPQQVSDKLEWGKQKKAGFSRRDVPKVTAE
jgi:hypothetical protein